jgi:glycosyltransferase involved in cell wall biosynthesis
MKLSVILPILNEECLIDESIIVILQKTETFCKDVELIAIDDGSTDRTPQLLLELSRKERRIKVITHKKNIGYGAALKSGIKHASYEWIFFTDADMQFDIAELRDFIQYTHEYDFIVGYRKKRADVIKRKFISFIYNRINRILFGLPLRDVDCAFKLMKRKAVSNIPIVSNSFFVSVELLVRVSKKGFQIKELGVTHFSRKRGVSKVTPKQVVSTIRDLVRLKKSL